ncbi:hypothetical protein D3C76_1613220 [compost metagenome]
MLIRDAAWVSVIAVDCTGTAVAGNPHRRAATITGVQSGAAIRSTVNAITVTMATVMIMTTVKAAATTMTTVKAAATTMTTVNPTHKTEMIRDAN